MPKIRGRIVLPDQILVDGVVTWEGKQITAVEPYSPEGDEHLEPSGLTVLPGLVDIHCHGGGGASFPEVATAQEAQVAVDEHRRHGTTTLVASLVTAPGSKLLASTDILAELADADELAGIHYEGPFISKDHCGAQNPAAIVPPDPALTAELLTRGRGHVKTMTIAPEIAPAIEVAEILIDGGALPSWGHTSADALATRHALDTTRPALEARGRRATVTHLFNGMPTIHHRNPGPALEFLAQAPHAPLVVEMISDGVHLAPETVRDVYELLGRENIVFVTDAMAAAGMRDGDYVLGSLAVTVSDGVARLTQGGSLAGGTSHLSDQLKVAVAAGIPLVDAVYMCATLPAAVIERDDVGAIAVGKRADLLALDANLDVARVIRAGQDVA